MIDDEEGEFEPEEPTEIPEADAYTHDAFDEYIGAQMMIPKGEGRVQGTIRKRARTDDGNPVGRRNDNPFLDTRLYEVELPDGIHISPIFNIADLKKYHDDGAYEDLILEPCPIPTSKKEEIEEILDSRVGRSTRNK